MECRPSRHLASIRRVVALLGVFLLMIGGVAQLGAHGPFDNSVALYVMEDHLEVGITLGVDAARKAFEHSGMAQTQVEEALMLRGPSSSHDLDVGVAAGLFTLSAGSEPVRPTRASIRTDGLEVLIAMDYPRPVAGQTKVQALYYAAAEEMGPGAFVVLDENRNVLAAATLSQAQTTAEVSLPGNELLAATTAVNPAVRTPAPERSATESSQSPISPASEAATARSWILWVAVGLLVGVVLWIGRRWCSGSGAQSH